MGGAKRVVLALGTLGEARQSATLAQRSNAFAAASQDLVRITLVSNVPDQSVRRGIKYGMQGDRELDDTEACAEMPAGFGDGIDGLKTQLIRKLLELVERQVLHVPRQRDAIEQGCLGILGHEQLQRTRKMTGPRW
jgi:hypothetical protein